VRRNFIILLLICFGIIHTGYAQLYTPGKIITTADGLSDNRITAIYKDPTGYIWIGTRNGLNRYDGQSFAIFKPQKGNSISNEVVTCITGDKEGNIWVGTMSGLNRYNPKTNTWTNWIQGRDDTTENRLKNYMIHDLEIDQEGLLWIACDVQDFTCYNPATNEFRYYDWPGFVKTISGKITVPGYHSIQAFVRKNQDEFWLGTNKGLVKLNIRTGEFEYLGKAYYADLIDLQYNPDNQTVYISAKDRKLFTYHEPDQTFRQETPLPEPYPSTHLPVTLDPEIWLASEMGLLRTSTNEPEIKLQTHVHTLSASIPPGGVTTTLVDDHGLGWIGTPNGLYLQDLSHAPSFFLPLMPALDKEGSNRMTSVYYDPADSVYYVGAYDPATLFILSKKDGSIRKLTKDAQGRSLTGCHVIKELGGQIWVLTEDRVYKLDRARKQLYHFPTPHDAPRTLYRDIEMDGLGRIWFTSFNKGIQIYDPKSGHFLPMPGPPAARIETAGTALQYDPREQKMWIATFGFYLVSYDFTNDSLSHYYEKDNLHHYSQLNLIHDLALDSAGNLWAATRSGGLYRYHPGQPYEKAFTQYDMRTGLEHNQFFSIQSGYDNRIWLLSEVGLSYLNAEKPEQEIIVDDIIKVASFGSDDRYSHLIHYNKSDDEVLVAAAGGLIFYYPKRSHSIDSFPLLVKPVPDYPNSFEYAGLHFGSGTIHYEYFLKGWSTEWTDPGSLKRISFQNLPPGSYRFQMRAVDHNGTIITVSEILPLVVHPPLWKNPWVIAALFGVLLLTVLRIINSLQQKVKDEQLLNQFATSLYGKSSIDDIFWDVTNNCHRLLGFEDCVIYQYDPDKKVLVQRAAAGPKSPHESREIINHLEIPLGKGIVGSVALTGKAERIGNTADDPRYVVDDMRRYSEITIPIFVDGKLFGIIDSEHSRRYFFKQRHTRLLKKVAAICGERISKYQTEERLRIKISRDLHDEMGSTLTSINILSKVAMAREEKKEELKNYLQKIKDHSGNMMESMSDMVWAINPANDSLEKVLIRMKEFAAEMLEPVGISYYFDTSGFNDKSLLNLEERRDLYLIFKEAITNIVKYSQATEVTISLQHDKEQLSLSITDNGNGFDSTESFSGNGLHNMKSRAEAIGGSLQIESIKGTGTSLLFRKKIT
jgi:signal transduction histidine kinase/ligand-binding sensor domain-containing protein